MADNVFAAGDAGLPRRKPLPLVASALWWAALSVFAFGYATYVDATLKDGIAGMGILAVLFFLTCSILWFLWSYWQGHEWTRDFVIIALAVEAAFFLYQASRFRRFAHGFKGFASGVHVVDFVLSVYIFCWLMTKEARVYFSS